MQISWLEKAFKDFEGQANCVAIESILATDYHFRKWEHIYCSRYIAKNRYAPFRHLEKQPKQ